MKFITYCLHIFTLLGLSLVAYGMEPDPHAALGRNVAAGVIRPVVPPVVKMQPQVPPAVLPVEQPPVAPRQNEEERRQEEEKGFELNELVKDIGRGLSWLASRPFVGIGSQIGAEFSAERFLDNLAQQFDPAARAGQGGAGNRAVSNFWRTFAQQFGPRGAGRETLDNITRGAIQTFFETLAQHMEAPLEGERADGNREGRAISHALQAMLQMLERELNNGGFERLSASFLDMWNRHIREGGPIARLLQTIEAQIERLKNQLEKGVEDIGKQANVQAEKLGKKVENVVKNVKDNYKEVAVDAEERYKRIEASLKWAALITATVTASAWFGSRFFWNSVERYFTQPELVTESSYKNVWEQVTNYFWPQPLVFREMIFSKEVKRELDNVVAITKHVAQENQKNNHAQVRYLNVLLWGPPGTGKTMFAKELAKKSGLDYAITSGASFSKFDIAGGIAAIDRLFNWAEKSKKGLIIFIDEAEAFLAERDRTKVKEENQLVTHFLSRTGEGSSKFMLIFATNKPEVLDEAIRRRTQRSIELGLPAKPEAAKILRLYRDKILLDKEHNIPELIDSVKVNLSDEAIEQLAEKLKGLAASELEDFINDVKVNADITDNRTVTKDVIDYVIDLSRRKHDEFVSHFHHAAPAA